MVTKHTGLRLNRDKGKGTITKLDRYRDRKGWMGRIRFLGADGKSQRKTVYGKTRTEVNRKMTEARRRGEAGVSITTQKETVAKYLERWYPTAKVKKIGGFRDPRPRTVDARKYAVNRMLPHIGSIKLQNLRTESINQMYDALKVESVVNGIYRKGLSPRSIQQIHEVLTRALSDAKKTLLINPATDANKPSPEKKEMLVLDSDEVKTLLSINDEWTPLFRTLLGTGLRIGEALALRYSDIDFDTNVINVSRTLFRVGKKLQFGDPKTDDSRRQIPLSPHNRVWESINKQGAVAHDDNVIDIAVVKATKKKLASDELVFPNQKGNPMDASSALNALKRSVRKIAANINGDENPKARKRWDRLAATRGLRIHDLRHTAATLMHQNGVDAKEIQTILGHRNIQTTYDLYIHETKESKLTATDTLDKVINR